LLELDRRPSHKEVEAIIEQRNQARKTGRFEEADEIRELLRQHGITVMDEKGGCGRGNEVTSWK